ncbi:Separin [Paragonimus heterotremus]|uniref:separase n=1 Tax=Paragonimus heterotremus TaxID=100268 RepID=A0A8J4WIX8_9TREM|nr:Separin [Paragonimus heterotremus]
MALIPLRYKDFFASKSWAAVCARGYFYWIHLHARCLFGATNEMHSNPETLDTFLAGWNNAVIPVPDSILHAAVIVRMHGRTLVQFMRQCCEQKLARQQPKASERTNENKENIPVDSSVHKPNAPKVATWGGSQLSDGELLNLWLGTRLLVRGCLHVTELYTLSGSVREARAYQNELLRVGQRFHLCACAQTAIGLMAHLDLFAQRKWAFELRMRQLNHIATCSVPLEEFAREHKHLSIHRTVTSPVTEETEDASFLHSDEAVSLTARRRAARQHSSATEEETGLDGRSANTLSVATNPLIAANAHAFASIFPCSPPGIRQSQSSASDPEGFPTFGQLLSLILGTVRSKSGVPSDANKELQKLDERLSSVGGLPLSMCIHRILHGVHWGWLVKIIRLVRDKLLPTIHYLPIVLPPSHNQMNEHDDTEALLHAFSALSTSPERNNQQDDLSNVAIKELSRKSQVPRHDVEAHLAPTTGQTMLPPNAPRRLADRRVSPRSVIFQKANRASRSKRFPVGDVSRLLTSKPGATPSAENGNPLLPSLPPTTPLDTRRPRSATLRIRPKQSKVSGGGRLGLSGLDTEPEDEFILKQLGYQLAPRKQRINREKSIDIYVDSDDRDYSGLPNAQSRAYHTSSKESHSYLNKMLDPVESCPSLSGVPHRPRNLRLASRWEAAQHRSTPELSPSSTGIQATHSDRALLSKLVAAADASSDRLADQLNQAYNQLAGLPIPNLARPICHWLGLHWLGKGSQSQAGRYLCQAVGIAPTNLFASILSSRLCEQKSTSPETPDPSQMSRWFNGHCRIRDCSIPSHPLQNQDKIGAVDDCSKYITVVQFCLIDELATAAPTPSTVQDQSAPTTRAVHDCLPLGLGVRSGGHLVVTRYTGVTGKSCSSLTSESRVIHGFSKSGLKAIDNFDELQVESLDSMQLQDRARYWRTRYKLDSRLESLLSEMRNDWFTSDDLTWILGRRAGNSRLDSTNPTNIVLVLDRRLIYLPWEWILSDAGPDVTCFTRSFSLPLVLGHLATLEEKAARSDMMTFNPHQTYYVLNPEANLSFTQQMFQPLFDRFATWRGVVGREPTVHEVNAGFTNHDLFIPFVAGLLWDVTDRDMDRFTLQFLRQWLFAERAPRPARGLGHCLAQASTACKLKHLVGKSVIVYGVRAEPSLDALLHFPDKDGNLEFDFDTWIKSLTSQKL